MEFNFANEEAFRQDVRAFLKNEISPQVLSECVKASGLVYCAVEEYSPTVKAMAQQLGDKGWLTLTLPREYGGIGANCEKEIIYLEEVSYHRIPQICIDAGIGGASIVAPMLMEFGSEHQRGEHLSRIAAGERFWCIGYSEPAAGTDLGSLQCHARREAGHYVVNGQKIWTTAAHFADWCWLAVRTGSPDAKHKGISILLVDMKSAGVSVRPLIGLDGRHHFNEVFFDEVAVPIDNRIANENEGWKCITAALNIERAYQAILTTPSAKRLLDEVISHVRAMRDHRHVFSNYDISRARLAEMAIEIGVGQVLARRAIWAQGRSLTFPQEATSAKLFATELIQRVVTVALQIFGLYGQISVDSSVGPPLAALVERAYLNSLGPTIFGGASEVERNIIATMVLGLPRH